MRNTHGVAIIFRLIMMAGRISPTRQLSIDFTRNLEEKSKQASPKDIEAKLEASWPAPTAMSESRRMEAIEAYTVALENKTRPS